MNDKLREILFERCQYAERISYLKCLKFKFIYLDETSLNLNYNPNWGYQLRGKRIRLGCVAPKSYNYSVLIAINNAELLGYKVFIIGIRGSDFFSFTRSNQGERIRG